MTRSYAALTTLVLGAGMLAAPTPAPAAALGATPAGYEADEATLTWSRTLRDPEAAADVQVDVARFGWARSQDVVVGTTRGPVAGRPSAGGLDSWVQVRTGAGALVRTAAIGTPGDDVVTASAPDDLDGYLVAGTTTGSLDPAADPTGDRAAFVRGYRADGRVRFTAQLRTPGLSYDVTDVAAVGSYGSTVVTGSVGPAAGGPRDAFIGVVAGSGIEVTDVAATSGDDVGLVIGNAPEGLDDFLLVAGTTTGDVDDPTAPAGTDRDRWFAMYAEDDDAPGGFTLRWRTQQRGAGDDTLVGAAHTFPAYGPRGIYWAGDAAGTSSVGALRVTDGSPRWQHPVGAQATDLVVGFHGPVVVGNVRGPLPGAPTTRATADGFLMGLRADGSRAWTSRVPGVGGSLDVQSAWTGLDVLTPFVLAGRVTGPDGSRAWAASLDTHGPEFRPHGGALRLARGREKTRRVLALSSATRPDRVRVRMTGCRAPGLAVTVRDNSRARRDLTRAVRSGRHVMRLRSLEIRYLRVTVRAAPGARVGRTACTFTLTSLAQPAARDRGRLLVDVTRR